jgi:hypothetical protein
MCNSIITDLWQSICRNLSAGSNKSPANLASKKVRWLNLAFTAMIAITIAACGAGGGGGGGGNSVGGAGGGCGGGGNSVGGSSGSTDFVVSGTVSAPGGIVAFVPRKNLFARLADVLISPAYAAITGLASVPDGTKVDLVRINNSGVVISPLATTNTSGGSYSFNLTKLGQATASDLVVQVFDSSNVLNMRAFVATGTVNIDPVSETTVRLVLEKSAISSLNNFTVQELADIGAAVNLLVMTKPLAAGLDIDSTVTAFKSAVAADVNITSFITAASAAGQTSQGPVDIGNYFPFDQGNTWVYQGTEESGGTTTPYTNTLQITGTKLINGITTTIFHESNSGNTGASEDYLAKDSQAISNYGNNDTTDFLTPLLVPYREYRFPFGLNGSFEAINKSGLSLPDAYPIGDGDGKPETVSVNVTVTVAGFETVIVPAGTYENAAKIVSNIAISIVYSSDCSTQTVLVTATEWYAPGAGLVKSISVSKNIYGGVTDTTTTTEVLATHVRQISLATNDLMYDPVNKRIYASVPSTAGSIGNSITLINPGSGAVGPSVPVGSEPGKLAISDNSQYLYVGLDGAAAVRRFDIATQTAGLQFSLGSEPIFGSFGVGDIEVLPGIPGSVAIARKTGWGYGDGGVAIYDDGVMRPTATPLHTGNDVIEFSTSSSRLYGYDNETSGFGLTRMSVNSAGVSIVDTTANLISGYSVDIKFDGGRLYATNGTVVDPEARRILGTFPVAYQYGTLVKPDSAAGRVYFLKPNINGSVTIQAYDLNTFAFLGSIDIAVVSTTPAPSMFFPSSFIRWGDKGLAFRTNENKVVLVKTALIP